ncbi:DUF6520 family protein [Sinomicrobium pectinilyticum]|nr:DUF6520 family protein [Sinomicrobium pectinilyticum]
MKRLKLILPMLAFILAIGMAFATMTLSDPTTDYILVDGEFEPLDVELNCGEGNEPCQVRIDGQVHQVYDAEDPQTAKVGDGNIIDL